MRNREHFRISRKSGDALAPGRLAYVQVICGELGINGKIMRAGDGAKIADETELNFLAGEDAEFLLFDLPPNN